MERAVLRIIDANFNRAREAARLMEEYCRFCLNCEQLSARSKQLRHQICAAVAELDESLLLASRDADGDVGRDMQVSDQLERATLRDCFTAAAKRLTEALRTLTETTQTLDRPLARTFEQLRFVAYTLEKDITLSGLTAEKFSSVRLYVIITVEEGQTDAQIHDLARACIAGGADCIQLRAKGIAQVRFLSLASDLVKLCRDANVISIINDRVDIATVAGADGVHLGQDDLPLAQARVIPVKPTIFGLSTHSPGQLKAAIAQRPDYVGLGPVFATATKPGAVPVGLGYISKGIRLLSDSGIAHVAVGGITLENVDQVIKAGARAIALCSGVTDSSNPEEICRKLKDKILLVV